MLDSLRAAGDSVPANLQTRTLDFKNVLEIPSTTPSGHLLGL